MALSSVCGNLFCEDTIIPFPFARSECRNQNDPGDRPSHRRRPISRNHPDALREVSRRARSLGPAWRKDEAARAAEGRIRDNDLVRAKDRLYELLDIEWKEVSNIDLGKSLWKQL